MKHTVEVNDSIFEHISEKLIKELKELKLEFPNVFQLRSLSVFKVLKRYPSIKELIILFKDISSMLETFESIMNKHLVNLTPDMQKEIKNRLISDIREKDGDKAASEFEKFISNLNIPAFK